MSFDTVADDYARLRPGYPEALVDWLLALDDPRRAVDLDCGAGIATRLLAGRGVEVTGVGPSAVMLVHARRLGGGDFRLGTSFDTGLPDRSIDLGFSAQAFDIPLTFAELRRILVPQGWCAAFWNRRAPSPFLEAYNALLKRASRESSEPGSLPTMAAIKARPDILNVREAEFQNRHDLHVDELIASALSSSHVVQGLPNRAWFSAALRALFFRHQHDGRVAFAYRTVAVAWQLD